MITALVVARFAVLHVEASQLACEVQVLHEGEFPLVLGAAGLYRSVALPRDGNKVAVARDQDPRADLVTFALEVSEEGPHARKTGDGIAVETQRLEEVVDAQLVVGRDALGDRHDERDAGVLGLEDRVGREARRDEDHRRVGAGLAHGVVERVEDRDALDVLAALAGRDAGHHVGPVAAVVEGVELPLTAGDPRHAQARVLADDDAHLARHLGVLKDRLGLRAEPDRVAALRGEHVDRHDDHAQIPTDTRFSGEHHANTGP